MAFDNVERRALCRLPIALRFQPAVVVTAWKGG
ncbi:hypothetical protein EV652_106130 [Kribbella steppae]|uniref:Uncharacterized protein n=1 Tax=Kribbella steppae TaxID=2512223 RepID=A0A4R2HGR7_9ACTN|nr:hypothetical protein EV652_106130 [Kribbella steppae]